MSTSRALVTIVGENLKAARLSLGISQEELAEISGLHRTYIGGIERGERNITLTSLEKLAEALKVPCAILVTDNNNQNVPHT